jgi:GTP-binding protein
MKPPGIATAEFEAAAPTAKALPAPGPPEVVFAGRSNVGKSSLINSLLNREKLVRVSSKPGCTRAVNFFKVSLHTATGDHDLRVVDLPGYGYAKVSKSERAAWGRLIEGYLSSERPIRAVVIIVDARRGPEEEEAQLLDYLESLGRPAVLVATKADKLPKSARFAAAQECADSLGLQGAVAYSSTSGDGRGELWKVLLALLWPR